MKKRDVIVLRAAVVWTFYVWITRMWNIWRDASRDTPFKVVHSVLAVISIAFAIAIWGISTRLLRNVRSVEAPRAS